MAAQPTETARRIGALELLAEAGAAAARSATLREGLEAIADGVLHAAAAEAIVIRIVDRATDCAVTCAVASDSPAVAAELEGTRFPSSELADDELDDLARVPNTVARAATKVGARVVLQVPFRSDEADAGCVEVFRESTALTTSERALVRVAAAQAALVVRRFREADQRDSEDGALALAGDALAASVGESDAAANVARLACRATGATASLLWLGDRDEPPTLVAAFGLDRPDVALLDAGKAKAVERAWTSHEAVTVESLAGAPGADVSATFKLGQPPIGALQLLFAEGAEPSEDDLTQLATFGVRAAQALRAAAHARTTAAELERTRALLGVVGEAISQLSLSHTLETAVERIAELLDAERVAVYLLRDGRLDSAAGIGLTGPHVRLAERLLELVLGPFRGRSLLAIPNIVVDPRVRGVGDAAAEAGIESAIALPLLAQGEAIGLLAVFPVRGRVLSENESSLLTALAAQLSVAVQNAQLHEEAKRLGEERKRALDSEQAAARQLRALYEISRSFAQSLSLDATVEAVARTVTGVLDVELAVIFIPDEQRESLVPRAVHVVDPRLDEVLRSVVARRLPFGASPIQRLFRLVEPVTLTPRNLNRIGRPATALIPFFERGWSGALVPISTPAEVLGALLVVSMRAGNRIDDSAIASAQRIGEQAALAIDNARLYQHQKEFADTMQRSLLPRSLPRLPGLDVGDAYQSSARLEVGGDIYDFIELDEGRLAVVLGDVTGHGIEAAADMAMAKFVFRSLAREHPAPSAFLQSVNDVVVGEIAPGKFITMVYLVVDTARGSVVGAGAGHPPPRLVAGDGTVRTLDVRGLVLGVEGGQRYDELEASFSAGDTVVLYTDGVLEARHEGELYGFERLDAIASAARHLSARDIAETILADCRDFARNELADDCAVVVIKNTG